MLRLVFVEASLETIPTSIAKHPSVLSDARRRKKKPTEIILDDSKHHSAMKNLERREKRGRPDIIHQCLLLALDSPIEDLEIFVHTVNDILIWINRKTRLPRNYNRFLGLMEDLFKRGEIGADETLLKITNLSLRDVLEDFRVVVMSERGEMKDLSFDGYAVCIGAFPHGEFNERNLRLFEDLNAEFVSIANKPVTALYTTCRVISSFQHTYL